ncbi:hypothetical protein CPAV1605_743 [seawater metagenome]|uniref:EamA domain-containing protein n=1 Tax=seawater metagenome TaxID=1561972 RepID=A0A5E8CI38_9ZZZZ
MNFYLLAISIIFGFLYPLYTKTATEYQNSFEVFVFREIIMAGLSLILILLYYIGLKHYIEYKLIIPSFRITFLLFIVSLLLVLTLPSYIYVLKENKIAFFITQYKILMILLPVLFGYLFFGEKLNNMQIISWLTSLFGLVLYYYQK